MRNINNEALNKVIVCGKLLELSFRTGKTKTGKPYEMATGTIRVEQEYQGLHEVSEIPFSSFASQYTNAGAINPAYENLQALKEAKTAQKNGIDAASYIRFSSGNLEENNFLTRSGQFINEWRIRPSFSYLNKGGSEIAAFSADIFIMDMREEMDRECEPTGRLIIKGGIIQYGAKMDVLEFVVENPDGVDYIGSNYEPNQTMHVEGRIRYTTQEEKRPVSQSSGWGEAVPQTTTRKVRELIVTADGGAPFDEEFSYDPVEIKKLFNERKARLEQEQMNQKAKQANPSPAPAAKKQHDWE